MSPSRVGRAIAVAAVLTLTVPGAGEAQYLLGGSATYQGYTFDAGLGADAAQLFMVPLAARFSLTPELTIDLAGAWAEGRVEVDNQVLQLSGPVDTSIKASYAVRPWAIVSVSANVPTGDATHTGVEAAVASVLSTDLLGFRETTWGSGPAITTSFASATSAGGFGVGLAAAYAIRGSFEPVAGDEVTYRPGSEARVRLGLDRNIGNNTLTAGVTFIDYQKDQRNAINLFQAGRRLRVDAGYAFRAGAGVWSIYGAMLQRTKGDLFLSNFDETRPDTTTAGQTLFTGGVLGTVGVGSGFVIRPSLDVKVQNRSGGDATETGSGWLVALGSDIPIRLFGGYDFFPKARVLFGEIKSRDQVMVRTLGLEFSGTMRWSF